MNGRKKDILIEETFDTDEGTGVRNKSDRRLIVWADKNLLDIIKNVEGVSNVYNFDYAPTQYTVYVDPRYDIDFVKSEIEAAVLCRGES